MKKQEPVPLGRKLMASILDNPHENKIPWYRRAMKATKAGKMYIYSVKHTIGRVR